MKLESQKQKNKLMNATKRNATKQNKEKHKDNQSQDIRPIPSFFGFYLEFINNMFKHNDFE
jgi:hypothetical protein